MAHYQKRKEPDPFFWIPLEKAPQRDIPVFHEAFRGWTGWLDLEIEVYSEYLYVGSGQIELAPLPNGQEQARYAFTRRDGKLVIPGTSIKGAVRAVFEAITNSCVSQRGWRERLQFAPHQACGLVRKGKEQQARLCPACRMFGTTGYRGRVYFSDAKPVDEIETTTIKISELWPPKRTQGRKFYETKSFQKQDFWPKRNTRFLEVLPKGVKFRTALRFENLGEAELGALIRALGIDFGSNQAVNIFPVKLGGAKPRCLGSVYFHPTQVTVVASPHQSWIQGLLQFEEEDPVQYLTKWLADTSLLDREAWKKFREKAKPRTDEACPREVY